MHATDKELLPENAGDIFFTDGPHPDHDISYTYIEKCDDLSYINKGISIKNFRANMGKRNLDSEFKLLRRLTENQMYTNQFRDYNPEIVKLDRYAQVVPFKHTIVRLPQITSEGSETECYINANFINSSKREESKAFIATQGPLETTRGHFWRMVWHNNVNLIIMLCKCRENNKNQSEQYWNKDKKDFEVDNYKVIMEAEEEIAKHLTRRTIRIEYNGGGEAEPQVKKVDHYQWVGWPDHETPSDEDVFVIEKFVDLIYEERTKHPDSPVVIHCSAGIGRSGTLIAIYNLEIVLRTYAESLDQVKLSVFGVVRRLREQRWGMVNTQFPPMGIGKSKSNLLKSHELDEFAKVTAFSLDQINNLYTHFKAISSIEKDDGVIDYDEFCAALETEKTLITKRLFQIFDENHDTVLNFREFIVGISILNEENIDMQIKLTFKLFDPEATGIIKADYVIEMLLSSLSLMDNMYIPKEAIQEIVNQTFDELNRNVEKDDKMTIDFAQYRKMVRNDPTILKWLYLNLDRVQQSAKLLLKNPKKYLKPSK